MADNTNTAESVENVENTQETKQENTQDTQKEVKDEKKTENNNFSNFSEEEFYNKMDSMLSKRIDGITKSILKDNGMDDDEIKDFVAKYKTRNEANKKASKDEMETLRKENAELKKSIFDTSILAEVNSLTDELGFNAKYIPQILKLADMTDINENGKVNKEKLKMSVEKVLEDCEAFKIQKEEVKKNVGFMNVGADKDAEENTDSLAKIRKAMGLK